MWEEWSIVVNIFQVDLDISVAHETFSTFILSENSEAPLRTAVRLVSIQRLIEKIK